MTDPEHNMKRNYFKILANRNPSSTVLRTTPVLGFSYVRDSFISSPSLIVLIYDNCCDPVEIVLTKNIIHPSKNDRK